MVPLSKDPKQKVGGGTETQRCEMYSPRQPKDKYQSREQQHSRSLAPACPHPHRAPPSAALPHPPRQRLCTSLLRRASARGLKSGTVCLEAHLCLLRVGAAGALVPVQITASAVLPKLFSSHCFVTTELRVTATRRGVGYHLHTETGWPHSFSEQNKTGNLLKMIVILHIHLRYLWCNSKTDNVLNWKHRDIRWISCILPPLLGLRSHFWLCLNTTFALPLQYLRGNWRAMFFLLL